MGRSTESKARPSVALLTEGVDRNDRVADDRGDLLQSPSSRRAWIEMQAAALSSPAPPVALLTEGVDRNIFCISHLTYDRMSPSSRRAWIEILQQRSQTDKDMRRPPHGGRG